MGPGFCDDLGGRRAGEFFRHRPGPVVQGIGPVTGSVAYTRDVGHVRGCIQDGRLSGLFSIAVAIWLNCSVFRGLRLIQDPDWGRDLPQGWACLPININGLDEVVPSHRMIPRAGGVWRSPVRERGAVVSGGWRGMVGVNPSRRCRSFYNWRT